MEMRLFVRYLILTALCGPTAVLAQLQLVPERKPLCFFAGTVQEIPLLWRNPGDSVHEADIQMRLMQLTCATAALVNEANWKRLRVLPGQTVLETAAVEFPAVNAETRFLVQWIANAKQVIGTTEVYVYPTNLLAELQPLAGHEDGALGIFDRENQLKPLLNGAKVNFVDLGNAELEKFRGKLAIIGPLKTQVDPELPKKIKRIAEDGVAIVWIQPTVADSSVPVEEPAPSFYSVPEDRTAAVIAQSAAVANLAGNPLSQLNLIYFCKIALHPQPLTFPFPQTQP